MYILPRIRSTPPALWSTALPAAIAAIASLIPPLAIAAQGPAAAAEPPRSAAVQTLLRAFDHSAEEVDEAADRLAMQPGAEKLVAEAVAAIEASWLEGKPADWARNALRPLEQWAAGSPAAARVLVRLLEDHRPAIRQAAMDAAIRGNAVAEPRILPLIASLHHAEPAERVRAAEYLAKFGERAAPAADALVRAAQDDALHAALRWEAVFALRDIGPAGVAGLVEVLKSTDRSVAYKTLDSLAQLGPRAGAAYEAVAEALIDHADPHVRSRAAAVLQNLPDRAAESTGLLRRALSDPNQHVRDAAEQALQRLQRGGSR